MMALLGDVASMSVCLLLLLCCCAAEDVPRRSTGRAADGLLGHLQALPNDSTCTVYAEVVAGIGERLSKTQKQCSEQTDQLNQLARRLSALESRLITHSTSVKDRLDMLDERAELWPPPRDCSDLPAGSPSGVYLLRPGLAQLVPALCDQDTDGGGWTVFQRRADIQPRQDFDLHWEEYRWGFGRLDGEFWWGLERLWLAMSLLDRQYELRVDLEDFDGEKRHAVYSGFQIAHEEDDYRLSVVNYTGDAGDNLQEHNGRRFSTRDKDHDHSSGNCARTFKAAWWFKNCHESSLNGEYLAGEHENKGEGIIWAHWRGSKYSLKAATMKIRPTVKL